MRALDTLVDAVEAAYELREQVFGAGPDLPEDAKVGALIVGVLIVLVAMERSLTDGPKPPMQLVRRLSRQWLDVDPNVDPRPVQVWLSRTRVRDAAQLSRKLRLSHEETVNLLNLAGYQSNPAGQRSRPKG